MKSCAGCTACCSAVAVKEIGLPEFTPCPKRRDYLDAAGPGCSIYATRPYSCRAWRCFWLASTLPDEYKPDRSGLVINENLDLIRVNGRELPAREIWALPGHEEDYHREEIALLIGNLIEHDNGAVLWRMKGGLAIAFLRNPENGRIERSAPHPVTPERDHTLGTTAERFMRAEQLAAHARGERSFADDVADARRHTARAARRRR